MTLRALLAAATILLALSAKAATAQGIPCSYQVQRIIGPDCDFGPGLVSAVGISPNGRYVCGSWHCAGGVDRPFVWIAPDVFGEPGTFMPINLPGFVMGYSQDVNDHGIVVGHVGSSSANFGFVYDLHTGGHTFLPAIDPDGLCWANAINNSNTVCGFRSIGSKGDPVNPQTAFIWNTNDGFTDLGLINDRSTGAIDINERGTVAGWLYVGFSPHLFIWRQSGEVLDLGSIHGEETTPWGLNEHDQVVGREFQLTDPPPTFANHGFVWSNGLTELFPLPGFGHCVAFAIADSGIITGHSRVVPEGGDRGCLWIGLQPIDVNTLIVEPSFHVENLPAISRNGVIVANGYDQDFVRTSVILMPITTDADIDGNCAVNIDDLLVVIGAWGPGPSIADINGDAVVNVLDLLIVINHWTP